MARERSVSDVCEVSELVLRRVRRYCLCRSCEICTVPSLHRPSTNGLDFSAAKKQVFK